MSLNAPVPHGLYAITPEQEDTATLCEQVSAAIAGGAVLVQYRNKIAAPSRRREHADALLKLCRNNNVPLIINDDLELANAIKADGVHLGKDDKAIEHARALLGNDAIIGASCYSDIARARAAEQAGASYLAFGAAFSSSTKPGAQALDFNVLQQIREISTQPLAVIGGITRQNLAKLKTYDIALVAVISDLFCDHEIETAARQFSNLYQHYWRNHD